MDIDKMQEIALDVLRTRGSHQPQLMVEDHNGNFGIILMEFDDKNKDKMRDKVRSMVVDKLKSERYFFISGGWVSMANMKNKGNMPSIRPSRDANRKECLIVSEYRKDQNNKSRMVIFHWEEKRNQKKLIIDDKQIWDKKGDIKEDSSLWNFFLEKEGVCERIDKQTAEVDKAFFKKEAQLMAKEFDERFKKMIKGEMSFEEKTKFFKEMNDYMEGRMSRVKQNMLEDVGENEMDK